ncbi:hypothetical protein MSCUN_06870 [Methanosphaera cuniculi]|uniref:Uncharacterized protein n=3 Tax=Methanosphaera cuniculi TaxID=1077256 RepID=A0A2V2BUC0_9EURY|nr:hypothetical protein MSCUN_06870 [Methanosphaera cuniculi]
MMHSYSDYVAQKLNTTRIITDEVMCMVGIENSRMNYIHYNDPLAGMTIKDNTNIVMFNMYQSMFSYNCAKFVLNTIEYNIATTTKDEIIGLLKLNSEVNLFLDNETGILKMHSNLTENVSMILDLKTGIMTYILCIDGFEYKGAITENLTPDIINQTNKNKAPSNYCFEDILCLNFKDKTKNILGLPLDSGWAEIEGMLGGILIDVGAGVFATGFGDGFGFIVGGGMMLVGGALLCADANGWTTDRYNLSRAFSSGLDIALCFFPVSFVPRTFKVFELATESGKIFDEGGKVGKMGKVILKGFDEVQGDLYGEAMDKILVDPFKEFLNPYLEKNN